MQIRFQLSLFANRFFIINYVTLIMAQDAPKRRFLSLIFLVSIIIIMQIFIYRTYHRSFMAVNNSLGCDRTAACKGASGSRYQSIFFIPPTQPKCVKPQTPRVTPLLFTNSVWVLNVGLRVQRVAGRWSLSRMVSI